MTRRALLAMLARPLAAAEHPIPAIRAALDRQYNCDFPGAHRILDEYIAVNPAHPLGHTFRASAYLFSELDRMNILAAEFLTDDARIRENKREEPDPRVRDAFFKAVDHAQHLARSTPRPDTATLFTLCLTEGMKLDYVALIDKRRIQSLGHARLAQTHAVELMRLDPAFVDAKLTAGVSEYVLGSLPFFLRWFLRFPEIEGSKEKAIANLAEVARKGYYLAPFARILLSIVFLREKRPQDAMRMLEMLNTEFPANPLIRKEYHKLRAKYPEPRLQPSTSQAPPR